MANPNITQVIFASTFAGLGQNEGVDFSISVPSQGMAANAAVIYTASTIMANEDSIPQVQIQFLGLDSSWWLLEGIYFYTADPTFLISTRPYFSNGSLFVQNFILNISGGGITLPAFAVNCRGFLYDAPF